jgi:molybdopterin biosynthesis enzyme
LGATDGDGNVTDRTARGALDRLTSLAGALAAVAPFCGEVAPVLVRIEEAAGCVAAEPIMAAADVPSAVTALIDGWAVAAQETVGASSTAPVFPAARPVRVAFGDPLPAGTDAVLPVHGVSGFPSAPEILAAAAPGDGARPRGGDFLAGEVIVARGTRLRPDHVALLRLAGVAEVQVRIARVGISAPLAISDFLAAMASKEGAAVEVVAAGAMPAPDADLFFAAGGPEELGESVRVVAQGVAVSSFEAIGCGVSAAGAPVVFAPDRPDWALAAWLLLGLPILRWRTGAADMARGRSLPLARKIISNPGVSALVLLRQIAGADGAQLWEPLATGALAWRAMAAADAWLLVDPQSEGYAAGTRVFAHDL